MTRASLPGAVSSDERKWRSMLYVPANRPDMIAKQERFGADVTVLDLEDGTPEPEKSRARELLGDAVRDLRASRFRGTVLVRVNPIDDAVHHRADLECVRALDIDGVVLPKAESAAAVREFADAVRSRSKLVVLGFETVAGVHRAAEILEACGKVDAAYFGGEDYIADLGGRRTVGGEEILYPRSQVSIACRLNGVPAVDTVALSFDSRERFERAAAVGRNLGYSGKLCIHPDRKSVV